MPGPKAPGLGEFECTSYYSQFSKTCNKLSLRLSIDYVTTNVNVHILALMLSLWSIASFNKLAAFS